MPTAHLSPTFYLLHTTVGNGAMNKLGSCSQWRSELLIPRMLIFSVGNGAMNALQYWQRRNELSALLETVKKCLQVHCSQYNYTTACWISFPCWQFVPKLPTAVQVGAETLKDSHRMGDGRIFQKTSALLSLIRAFQMRLILAGSISLDTDSTFKWTLASSLYTNTVVPP
jgi:hypothetical protein